MPLNSLTAAPIEPMKEYELIGASPPLTAEISYRGYEIIDGSAPDNDRPAFDQTMLDTSMPSMKPCRGLSPPLSGDDSVAALLARHGDHDLFAHLAADDKPELWKPPSTPGPWRDPPPDTPPR